MITAPAMVQQQESAWLGLLEVTEIVREHWCLVGGQMVHMYCWERGLTPTRPTNDGDAALDVRARPEILEEFTAALMRLGFTSAGSNASGHEHRWVRGDAQLDVLIPTRLGATAASRTGATGSTTLAAPGTRQAIARSELVAVDVGGTVGRVPRPSLLGALVVKAAAYGLTVDTYRYRHLPDLAVLAAMIQRSDHLADDMTKRDRMHLAVAMKGLERNRAVWVGIDGAERGVDVLASIVAQ